MLLRPSHPAIRACILPVGATGTQGATGCSTGSLRRSSSSFFRSSRSRSALSLRAFAYAFSISTRSSKASRSSSLSDA